MLKPGIDLPRWFVVDASTIRPLMEHMVLHDEKDDFDVGAGDKDAISGD